MLEAINRPPRKVRSPVITMDIRSASNGATFLRRVLQLDALICAAGGIAVAAAAGPIARFTGIASPLAIGISGVLLVPYAVMLFMATRQEPVNRRVVIASVIADLLCMAGSIVLLLTDLVPLTPAGWWLELVLAVGLAGMADAKLWGLWRSRPAT